MIRFFEDQGTADLFAGRDSTAAQKACPPELWSVAKRKLDLLNQAELLTDLGVPPENHLQNLKDHRKGLHSIRINDLFRVRFRWTEQGPEDVQIVEDGKR
jgi:proteic killer suppression protein